MIGFTVDGAGSQEAGIIWEGNIVFGKALKGS